MTTWFTSDQHFYHQSNEDPDRGIIPYCNRPFENIEQMHEVLIERWNNVVGKNDDVMVLGDLMMGMKKLQPQRLKDILKQLNGRKQLIMGNHDQLKEAQYSTLGFDVVWPWYWWSTGKETVGLLIHSPHEIDKALKKDGVNPAWLEWVACGHVHNMWTTSVASVNGQSIPVVNVGVDVHEFTPIDLARVIELAEQTKKGSTLV